MNVKRSFTLPVTLDTGNRRKDRSVRIATTTTLEVSNEDFALLDTFMGHTGWLMFAENELTDADVPADDAPVELGQKKPSMRLRNVLYRVWQQKTDQAEPFDASYYPRVMEQLISRYKAELEG